MLDSLEYGWQVGPEGHLVWRGQTSRFIDPSMFAPIGWPLRTTVVQRSGDLVSARALFAVDPVT